MQEGGQETARKPKSNDGTYTLTTIIDGNYVPLIFDLNNGEIVSLNVYDAILFEHYVVCEISGIIRYEEEIDEANIEEYVDDTDINCSYREEGFGGEVLIDTLSGQVVSLDKLGSVSSWVSFNEEYIFLNSQQRIVRIPKSNLNHAVYITSDLEAAVIDSVFGDYVICDTKAYLIDNSDVATSTANTLLGQTTGIDILSYLLPSDLSAKYIYVLHKGNGSEDNSVYISKVSVEKGYFGDILANEKLDGSLFESEFRIRFRINIPNSLRPYTQTIRKSFNYTDYGGLLYANSIYDETGNVMINCQRNSYFYFQEDDSELGARLVEVPVSGYSCLDNIKKIPFDDGYDYREAYLYQDKENLYFLNQDDRICHLNILEGTCDVSNYYVKIDRADPNFLTTSGKQIIYKEMLNGTDYVTKAFDVTDLITAPVIVDYETSDIINLPDFSI